MKFQLLLLATFTIAWTNPSTDANQDKSGNFICGSAAWPCRDLGDVVVHAVASNRMSRDSVIVRLNMRGLEGMSMFQSLSLDTLSEPWIVYLTAADTSGNVARWCAGVTSLSFGFKPGMPHP